MSKRAIGKEAADWVVALQGSDATAERLQAFRVWLQQSPLHVGAYLKAESVWLALRQIDSGRQVDVDALLEASSDSNVVSLHPTLQSGPPIDSKAQAHSRPTRRWLAAAALAAVVVGGLLGRSLYQPVSRFETALGEQHTSRLDDGSVMELNTQTALRVHYSRAERRIELINGEAFFSVQKSAGRPFVVAVDGYEVTAVGTSFNVYRQPAALVVTVSEGIVDLAATNAGGERVRIGPGQQAVVAEGRAVLSSGPAVEEQALAWRQNRIVCLGEPLQKVIAEINRYNDRKLIIKDPTLSDRRVSGVFGVNNPELIVQFLERSAGVSVEESRDGSWLLREGKAADGGGRKRISTNQ